MYIGMTTISRAYPSGCTDSAVYNRAVVVHGVFGTTSCTVSRVVLGIGMSMHLIPEISGFESPPNFQSKLPESVSPLKHCNLITGRLLLEDLRIDFAAFSFRSLIPISYASVDLGFNRERMWSSRHIWTQFNLFFKKKFTQSEIFGLFELINRQILPLPARRRRAGRCHSDPVSVPTSCPDLCSICSRCHPP